MKEVKKSMEKRMVIGVLLVAVVCLAVAVQVTAQPSPFVISGWVNTGGGEPCDNPCVEITNLNTSENWSAENSSETNYYQLVLNGSGDVQPGEILRINVSGCVQSSTIERTILLEEVNNGGFIRNISLGTQNQSDLTVTAIGTPARFRAEVVNPVSAVVENDGSENATSFNVSLKVNDTVVDTATVVSLEAGENTTVDFTWTPVTTGNYTLNVTADANDEIEELDETNNLLTKDVTVLEKLTVTASVRIEGKNDTVWTGTVTFSNSSIVADNGKTYYLNEPTALGALDEANKTTGFGYKVAAYSWGLYVYEVAGEPPIGWDGWMYRVNYASPWVGAVDYTLYGGEDGLWYFGAWTAPPLRIELYKTTVDVGKEFIATVTAYNDSTALFDPVENATVFADALTFLTGSDGKATISLDTAGNYTVYADKGTWKDYVRSEKKFVKVTSNIFDTGEGTYPSISGTHYGKIIPDEDVTVNRIYTYPCAGTGGHAGYVEIGNETLNESAVAEWSGYVGDYHNLSFNPITLRGGVVYSYVIKTGSYPQIIHAPYKQLSNGNITCTRFEDANRKEYGDWIPAFRLWYAA